MQSYKNLEARFGRLSALGEALGMLQWDNATMMPPGGAGARGEQLAALSVTRHELLVSDDVATWLEEAASSADALDSWQRANLKEMRRAHAHASALEGDLVEAMAKASLTCEHLWREARAKNDFKSLLPAFREVLHLTRQAGAAKGQRFGCSLYEALLDSFEPYGKEASIDLIFADLEAFIKEVLPQILERQKSAGAPLPLEGPFPESIQEALGRRLMALAGFDFNHGRLDRTFHPFCGGVPEDVRVTTRYFQEDFTRALMGVLHETGHALYERGLPKEWRRQPVGEARGMTLHESQSLLVEMQASRSQAYLSFLAPLTAAAFGRTGPAWSAENFRKVYNRVQPSFIRVDADEVTYPAHVILRYRLEKAMLAGDLDPADLPGAWAEGMRSLLGITPPSDTLGCLQDVHWYDGAWGYFPTYSLGALAAAQLMAAAKKAVPDLDEGLARGNLSSLMAWLGEAVHSRAASQTSDEILIAATGQPLSAAAFKAHVKERYLA